MTHEREPARLLGEEGVAEELRQALQRASQDGPSPAEMKAIVDGTLASLGGAGAAAGATAATKSALLGSGWLKLALVVGALGAGSWVVLQGTDVDPGARASLGETAPKAPAPVTSEGVANQSARAAHPSPPVDELGPEAELATDGPPAEGLDPAAQELASPSVSDGPSRPVRSRRADKPRASTPTTRSLGRATPPSRASSRSVPKDSSASPAPAPAPAPAAEPAPPDAPPADTALEVELLSRAQQALPSRPEHALELLSRHRKRYPSGGLAQERDALELEALARLRRTQQLQRSARAFLARYPGSPHRERVTELLQGTP